MPISRRPRSTRPSTIPTRRRSARQPGAARPARRPIVKGWCTEQGVEIASTGIQVHGGMGFIEETGAAQYLRDARITTIYEGTTGIQANDLVGRKVAFEKGATALAVIEAMRQARRAARRGGRSGVSAARRIEGRRGRSRRGHALARRELREEPAGGVGRVGALSQAFRHRRRRLDDGARCARRAGRLEGPGCRSRFSRGEARHARASTPSTSCPGPSCSRARLRAERRA